MKKISNVAVFGNVGGLKVIKPLKLTGITGGGIKQMNLMPEALREWARRIGEKRAKRVWRLMRKGAVGTLPELCAWDWLDSHGAKFEAQSFQMGGRSASGGGAVVDFVVWSGCGVYMWRIQGEYWHQGEAVERKDEVQKANLRRVKVGGLPVIAVLDLWENDVYDRYPEVFEKAEVGEELR